MKPQTLLLFAVAILLLLASLASCDSGEQFEEVKQPVPVIDSFRVWCSYMDSASKYGDMASGAMHNVIMWQISVIGKYDTKKQYDRDLAKHTKLPDSLYAIRRVYLDSAKIYDTR